MDPTLVPKAIGKRAPAFVRYEIETVELNGRLDDGTTFTYWTFGRKVPGPMLRVKQGDTVELTLANAKNSKATHSIDLHAVTGGHGGGADTQVAPGQSKTVRFKALNPGLYVYHCATPSVPHHISAGMYGLILVEPDEGLRRWIASSTSCRATSTRRARPAPRATTTSATSAPATSCRPTTSSTAPSAR